mmetsp:Transcript_16119/g.34010  ORF Transcript_16119/g.34010 Transcript_16119/m.34010 type:complete len:86 (-) Transcript_16119:526-783(-)
MVAGSGMQDVLFCSVMAPGAWRARSAQRYHRNNIYYSYVDKSHVIFVTFLASILALVPYGQKSAMKVRSDARLGALSFVSSKKNS